MKMVWRRSGTEASCPLATGVAPAPPLAVTELVGASLLAVSCLLLVGRWPSSPSRAVVTTSATPPRAAAPASATQAVGLRTVLPPCPRLARMARVAADLHGRREVSMASVAPQRRLPWGPAPLRPARLAALRRGAGPPVEEGGMTSAAERAAGRCWRRRVMRRRRGGAEADLDSVITSMYKGRG
jgi:hypothetical protein